MAGGVGSFETVEVLAGSLRSLDSCERGTTCGLVRSAFQDVLSGSCYAGRTVAVESPHEILNWGSRGHREQGPGGCSEALAGLGSDQRGEGSEGGGLKASGSRVLFGFLGDQLS